MGEPRERRLISEYCALKFPRRRVVLGMPLGPLVTTPEDAGSMMQAIAVSRPWRPEVDALVYLDDALLLIEGKLQKWLDGMAKLPIYASLVDSSPELEPYRTWPRKLRLVIPWTMPQMVAAARSTGVELDEYSPDWVKEYVAQLHVYWHREYRLRREERKKRMQELGIE